MISDTKKIMSIQIDIEVGDLNTGRVRLKKTYEAAIEAASATFKKEHGGDDFVVKSRMTYGYRHFVLSTEESGAEDSLP